MKRGKRIISLALALCMVGTVCEYGLIASAAEGTVETTSTDKVEFNGHYYQVYDTPMTWDEAKAYCESLGGHLVTITSQEEQELITNYAKEHGQLPYFYIGGYKQNNSWNWVTGEKFEYTYWAIGEPNGSGEYMQIYNNLRYSDRQYGVWDDTTSINHNKDIGFICEWDSEQDVRVEFNGHYYQVYDTPMTWDEAKAYCESLGGHLVTITSGAEQEFVESLIANGKKKNYWLGGTDAANEGTWEWITGEKLDYTNWREYMPDNWQNEDYLMMYKEMDPSYTGETFGRWNDLKSDGTCPGNSYFSKDIFGFICEWDNGNDVSNETGTCITQMEIVDHGQYTGNQGDSRVFHLDKSGLAGNDNRYYGNGNIGLDGTEYNNGLEVWIARWNFTEEISWAYATYKLDSKFTRLTGKTSLIKSANTDNFDTTIYFYDGDTLLQSYTLTNEDYEKQIDVDVSGVDELKILVQDNKAVKRGTSFALYDMFLDGEMFSGNSEQNFINEHYNFANSQTFVTFKDENMARTLSDSLGWFKKFWYNTMAMNWFTNYYDVVVAEVFSSPVVQSPVADRMQQMASSEARSIASQLIDAIQTVDGSNMFSDDEIMEVLLSFVPSDHKGTAVYNYLTEVFGKHWEKIIGTAFETFGYLNNLFTIVGIAGDIVEGMVNCLNYAAAVSSYIKQSQEMKQIVKEAAERADGDLQKALNRFAEIDSSEDIESISQTLLNKCIETGASIQLKTFVDLCWDKVIPGLTNFVLTIAGKTGMLGASSFAGTTGAAVASGILSGISLGMTVSNLAGNLSSVTYYMSSVEKGAEFADVVWGILTQKEQQLREDKTLTNAMLFDSAFNLYKSIQLLTIKNALAASAEHDGSFIRSVFGKKEDVSWLVSAQCAYQNIKCHSGDYTNLSGATKGIVVACPVDVFVYSNGALCAQVVDNKAEVFDESIAVAVIGEEKYISVPSEKEYQLEIRATDAGTMDYTIFENGAFGTAQRMISTEDIPLQTGQLFTGNIPSGEQVIPENYRLTTDSGLISVDKSETVVPASEVMLDKSNVTLKAGESEQLIATVLPENTSDKTISWVSDNENVARVDAFGNIVAVAPGEATIYAIGQQDVHASCRVLVQSIPVQGIALNQSEARLNVNEMIRLNAVITPNDATNQSIVWSSSKPEIASVDQQGNVKAIAPGTAVITATAADGGYTASCTITVFVPTLTLTLNGQAVEGDVAYVKLPSVWMMYKNHSATLGFVFDREVEVESVKWSYANWSVDSPEANIESPGSSQTVIRPNGKGIGARSTWVTLTVTDADGNAYRETVKVRFYKWDWQKK